MVWEQLTFANNDDRREAILKSQLGRIKVTFGINDLTVFGNESFFGVRNIAVKAKLFELTINDSAS